MDNNSISWAPVGAKIICPDLRVDPARDGVAEEDKVRDDSAGVDTDHLAHSSERGVLLVIIPDVPQTRAPRPDELKQRRSDNLGADKTHPTNRDRSVLQQRLRGVLSVTREKKMLNNASSKNPLIRSIEFIFIILSISDFLES